MNLALPHEWIPVLADAVALKIEERERWVSVEGLADWLGCSPDHIYDLRQRGLPARRLVDDNGRLSKRLIFRLSEVAQWLEESSVAT